MKSINLIVIQGKRLEEGGERRNHIGDMLGKGKLTMTLTATLAVVPSLSLATAR